MLNTLAAIATDPTTSPTHGPTLDERCKKGAAKGNSTYVSKHRTPEITIDFEKPFCALVSAADALAWDVVVITTNVLARVP